MNRWIMLDQKAEWADLHTSYTKSAFRWESQQVYSSELENAALGRFLAGEPHGLDLSWVVPKLRAQVAAGRSKTVIRVVVEPPSDYTRFELAVYPELAAEGEDIRVIAVSEGEWPGDLPDYDYWIFDDQDIWRMHYNDDHTFYGAELLEGEAVAEQHLEWREIALDRALPLQEYLAARGTV